MTDPDLTNLLNRLVADASVFHQKLRHYHWNVQERRFFELHERFEILHTRWADVIDGLAERMRAMGEVPLHTMAAMLRVATLEEDETVPDAESMVRAIAGDLERLHAGVSAGIEQADMAGHLATASYLAGLLEEVEKEIWMLGAWLHDEPSPAAPHAEAASVEAVAVAAGAHSRPYMEAD